MNRAHALALVLGTVLVLGVVLDLALLRRPRHEATPCAPGFVRAGLRCQPPAGGPCPSPLVATDRGCDEAERDVVAIPATVIVVGPSDWEAEGRVAPRTAAVGRFAIDRLEVTVGRACASPAFDGALLCVPRARAPGDVARAASGVPLGRARAYCRERGGRLPTEDEWLAAAAGDKARRYPWGDTGAVCRRAVWGIATGPCGEGADGPDTVGAHPDGATPLGVQDLAGNVAEWTETGARAPEAVLHGGNWATSLATELRTWARAEAAHVPSAPSAPSAPAAPTDVPDRGIGFRCAYDEVP